MQELTGMLGIATVKPGTQPRKFVALTDPNRSQTRDYSHVRRTVQGGAGCRGAAACWVLGAGVLVGAGVLPRPSSHP